MVPLLWEAVSASCKVKRHCHTTQFPAQEEWTLSPRTPVQPLGELAHPCQPSGTGQWWRCSPTPGIAPRWSQEWPCEEGHGHISEALTE